MTRVSIHSLELTPLECEDLSSILQAKLEEHLANRAKYMRKDSGAAINQAGGSHADAGDPQLGKPATLQKREAVLAWDLTLRCPDCNSTVEGRCDNYHCYACARRGR